MIDKTAVDHAKLKALSRQHRGNRAVAREHVRACQSYEPVPESDRELVDRSHYPPDWTTAAWGYWLAWFLGIYTNGAPLSAEQTARARTSFLVETWKRLDIIERTAYQAVILDAAGARPIRQIHMGCPRAEVARDHYAKPQIDRWILTGLWPAKRGHTVGQV
jgi:hypothetical protein